jgi:hypothetical protein
MNFYKLFLSLLFFIPLTACHKDIDFNGEETDPLLVINSLPCTDSLFTAEVTASNFFLANTDTFKTIGNATVALYLNGAFVENMVYRTNGIYQSSIRPREGDLLRMNVSATGYKPVIAEDIFCAKTNIIRLDTTSTRTKEKPLTGYGSYDSIGFSYSRKYVFHITFSDPVGKNYYRLVVKHRVYWSYENEDQSYYDRYLTNFDDIIFGNKGTSETDDILEENVKNTYNIFNDELIEGKEYTLNFEYKRFFEVYNDYTPYTQPEEITVDLQAISKNYYLYLKSIDAFNNSEDDLFSEKVAIYSNVEGGTGIVASRTFSKRTFWLP